MRKSEVSVIASRTEFDSMNEITGTHKLSNHENRSHKHNHLNVISTEAPATNGSTTGELTSEYDHDEMLAASVRCDYLVPHKHTKS